MTEPQPFNIEFSEQTVSFAAAFTDDEWALFDRFLSASERLIQSRLFHATHKFVLTEDTAEVTGHSDEELDAVRLRLRPFQLHDESTSINRFQNVVKRRIEREDIRDWLKSLGKQFRSENSVAGYSVKGVQVNSEEVFIKWLNAYHYHGDRKIQDEIGKLFVSPDVSVFFFILMLKSKAMVIYQIAGFIEQLVLQRVQH